MDDVTAALRAAVSEPPPSGIDLGSLVAGEERRERRVRYLTIATAVTAALAGVVAIGGLASHGTPGPSLVAPASSATAPASPANCPTIAASGQPRQFQSEPPRRIPTEGCGEAAARLDQALAEALRTTIPGAVLTSSYHPDQPVWFTRDNDLNVSYGVGVSVRLDGHAGQLGVQLEAYPPGTAPTQQDQAQSPSCGADAPDTKCRYERTADGTVATAISFRMPDGWAQHQVAVLRPDGTYVVLLSSNIRSTTTTADGVDQFTYEGPEPPLTVDQLIAIGRAPGLTLYP